MLTFKPLFLAAALSAFTLPAMAQAPVRQGVTSGEIAGDVQSLRQSNAELRLQLNEMQRDMAELNGKIETLEFLLSQSRDEINRMQGDDAEIGRQLSAINRELEALAERMQSVETGLANVGTQSAGLGAGAGNGSRSIDLRNPDGSVSERTVGQRPDTDATSGDAASAGPAPQAESLMVETPTGGLGTISASDLPGEAGALFAEAKSRLLQFDYAGAEVAFRAFLSEFGDDPQAGEAKYWLGEVLYQQDQYEASGAAYRDMIQAHPDDPRAPDALVKLARSLRLVGETEQACNALDLLPQRYPDASSVTRNLAAVERTRSGCAS